MANKQTAIATIIVHMVNTATDVILCMASAFYNKATSQRH